MAGLLSSWWSGKQPEEKKEGDEDGGDAVSDEGKEEGSESSWVAGFEGKHRK